MPLKILGCVVGIMYPVFVFVSINILHLPMRILALGILVLAVVLFAMRRGSMKSRAGAVGLGAIALIVMITSSETVLRFYPVLVNCSLFIVFSLSMRGGDSIIFHFAELWDRRVRTSPDRKAILGYCRKVNIVWCCFFIFNISVSLYTVFWGSSFIWAIYNSFIVYILIGTLFAGEFIVRCIYNRKLTERIFLSATDINSRHPDHVVAYSGKYSDGNYLAWKDFVADVSRIRSFIEEKNPEIVVVHVDDFYLFLASITAAMQCRKDLRISANNSPGFVSEMTEGRGIAITDNPASGFDVKEIVKRPLTEEPSFPPVSPDSPVSLFTSGSTGKPKAVLHTIFGLENDNSFFMEKWKNDFKVRSVVSSVNPHHIFGLIFSVLRPFAEGVPFRRERIEDPMQFLPLGNEHLLIVTTPYFLDICTKDPDLKNDLKLNDPYIAVSGGALSRETAAAAEEVFGVWPTEIYGSTETGGIAWRITKDLENCAWHPADDVKLSLADDGCLIVSCPSIFDGQPLHTQDLVSFDDSGNFTILGRKDSVVKIAEKRISTLEVEGRIKETGYVSDAKVILLGNERKYLGAAVVLSDEGRKALKGMKPAEYARVFRKELSKYLESVTIPRKWRFVDAIPRNSMGKIQMEEVEALFRSEVE